MSDKANLRFLDRTTPPHIFTLVMLASVSALAMGVFLPSLGNMATHFEVDYAYMQLAVALYLAMSGVMQLFIGPISDKYGRRSVLLWGLTIYTVATLGCIYAPSAGVFMIFRMLQATAAVAMVLSRAIVRDCYPADQAASVIGYVTMGMSVIPMIAPAVGGFLDVLFGWQASFWMLFAGGVLMVALVYYDLAETAPPSENTLTGQFAEYPELLTSPRFWGYCIAAALSSGAFFAYLGGATFVGADVYSLTPDVLGIYFAAPSLGYFVGNFLTGRYAARMGLAFMIFWGSVLCVISLGALLVASMTGQSSEMIFFGAMIIVGVGNGMVIPNAQAGMLSVRPRLAGTAAGLGGAIMIGGGAALSALAGALLTPGSTELPLVTLMFTSCLLGLLVTLMVARREKRLNTAL